MSITACQGCCKEFPSRNAVFRHLLETNGQCLSPEDHVEFVQYVQEQEREKVILLFGYLTNQPSDDPKIICNGSQAAQLLLQVVNDTSVVVPHKINRSYGNTSRRTRIVQQDDWTSAITEVVVTRLPPLTVPLDDWLHEINDKIRLRLDSSHGHCPQVRLLGRQTMTPTKFNAELDVTHRRVEYLLPLDFLYRHDTMSRNDFFQSLPSFVDGTVHGRRCSDENHRPRCPSPDALTFLHRLKRIMQSLTTKIIPLDETDAAAVQEKGIHVQKHLRQRGRRVENQQTDPRGTNGTQRPDASDQNTRADTETNGSKKQPPDASDQNARADTETNGSKKQPPDSSKDTETNNNGRKKKQAPRKPKKKGESSSGRNRNLLKRRRFHNFTATVMAHEFLAYRRMDRLYHRATLRFQLTDENRAVACNQDETQRPFLVISMSGDIFLNGQACRVIGLVIALARGLVDHDFVDCVFDEDYGHLVPTPPAPPTGLYAGEAFYVTWEGKVQSILSPRKCDRFDNGWCDDKTINRVEAWRDQVRQGVAHAWLVQGVDEDNRLVAEREWTENVLEPWAVRAREQLEEYRQWKAFQTTKTGLSGADPKNGTSGITLSMVPCLTTIDPTVPPLFQKVLHYLRQADTSGVWPCTTPKRQMVMISDLADNANIQDHDTVPPTSLSVAHDKAKSNKQARSSAYIFAQGQGGASGSFSVGAMPGDNQPRANTLFPELVKAAFELEISLRPDREPSSTIAVNRNAQFRPHTDSGAGAGQSTSLIVGLGTYAGGELVVEGERKDIRYQAVEFDGWRQRHWTMPFKGERYSLVWFTPKGCEGVRGIDLCSSATN